MSTWAKSSPDRNLMSKETQNVSYSTLANIPRGRIQKIINESKPMIGCAKKCRNIWAAIWKADFWNEGSLNEANIELVFEKNKETIYELLRITTVHDFVDVFDWDKDGFLNEDEQVSIFSLIKEKMQLLAEELATIHEYQMYKDIMKEVWALENDIVGYQSELWTNI